MSNTYLGSNQPSHGWWYLTRRMEAFIANLAVTDPQARDGDTKQARVRATLNRHYYKLESETANSMLTGAWGKHLRVRPPRDVDVLFVLPWDVYYRFEARAGNTQSQLLQEVKDVLGAEYTASDMGGDGQVVVVRFATMPVEVVPAFEFSDGQFWICDTNDGGSYRLTDPRAEMVELDASDQVNRGVTRHLIRIMKQWQRHCAVPLKSFILERLAIEFLRTWPYDRSFFWYDWLIRDSSRTWSPAPTAGSSCLGPGNGWPSVTPGRPRREQRMRPRSARATTSVTTRTSSPASSGSRSSAPTSLPMWAKAQRPDGLGRRRDRAIA